MEIWTENCVRNSRGQCTIDNKIACKFHSCTISKFLSFDSNFLNELTENWGHELPNFKGFGVQEPQNPKNWGHNEQRPLEVGAHTTHKLNYL